MRLIVEDDSSHDGIWLWLNKPSYREAFQLCHQNRTHLYTKTCAAILENGFVRGSMCGIETGLKDERLNSRSSGGVAQCNKY